MFWRISGRNSPSPLPPPKSLLRDEKALMEQIDAAFDGVTLEDGIGLMTTQLLDMYAPREVCAAVAPCEERSDWRRHHARHGPGMLGRPDFTDPKGYRFLLPAWLTLDLRGQLGDFDALDYLPLLPENCGIYESQAVLLNDRQLEAVINFIEYRQREDCSP